MEVSFCSTADFLLIDLFILSSFLFFFLALRGIQEELGIDASCWDFQKLSEPYLQVYEDNIKHIWDREWTEVYLFKVPPTEKPVFTLQDEEVSEVKWVKVSTLLADLTGPEAATTYTSWFRQMSPLLPKCL